MSPIRRHINLFIVFLVSGLWHGANWTFVIWGALNGFYIVFGTITKILRSRFAHLLGMTKVPRVYTFLQSITTFFLITFSWIFFRANTISDAFYIIEHLFSGIGNFIITLAPNPISKLETFFPGMIIAIMVIAILLIVESIQTNNNVLTLLKRKSILIRWIVYYALILSIVLLGTYSNAHFIYFQF